MRPRGVGGPGTNLRTNRAKPQAVAQAVRAVLSDSSYREASSRIGGAIRASRGVDGLADLVADVCSGRRVERGKGHGPRRTAAGSGLP
jgi:UDP:flavonoid glycosyltransferase YjiC (YdhE family)